MKISVKIALFVLTVFVSTRCSQENALPTNSITGGGGSLARFTIIGNFLYAVDFHTLSVFDISKEADPVLKTAIKVGNGVETIFPLNNRLFLGTNSGMLIYELDKAGTPQFVSEYQHITSCDPVVANTSYAFVTLRASRCGFAVPGAADQLDIIDISNPKKPTLVTSYTMSEPRGLGLNGTTLFVCDGHNGVRVFDVQKPTEMKEIAHLEGIIATDVIVLDGLLLVVGPENIYQYDYSDLSNIRQLSNLPIGV